VCVHVHTHAYTGPLCVYVYIHIHTRIYLWWPSETSPIIIDKGIQYIALGRETQRMSLCDFEFAGSVCLAVLQSRKLSGVSSAGSADCWEVCRNEGLNYGAKKLSLSVCVEVMCQVTKPLRPDSTSFGWKGVYTNNLESRVNVFLTIRLNKSTVCTTETQRNSSIKRPGNCRHYIWHCTQFCTDGCTYLHTKCRLSRSWSQTTHHINRTLLLICFTGSTQILASSKHHVSWRGYVSPVRKCQWAQYMDMGF
jgi:hypothetical protein